MELIEFAEKRGEEAAKFSLGTLDVGRARAHNLLVLLLGGAGAMVGLVMAHGAARPLVALLGGVVAVWWFGLAAWLAVRGLRTSPVRTWAGEGARILRKGAEWEKYEADTLAEGGQPNPALLSLRRQELELMADAAAEYRSASTQCAAALDCVYLLAALTPLPMLLVWSVSYFWGGR